MYSYLVVTDMSYLQSNFFNIHSLINHFFFSRCSNITKIQLGQWHLINWLKKGLHICFNMVCFLKSSQIWVFSNFLIILIYFLKIVIIFIQKASNPVYWYPWGEEAFQAAIESNKLIFLSVGYSTCHWCHVMERESFESQEVCMYNFSILREFFYYRQVIWLSWLPIIEREKKLFFFSFD